MFDKNSLNEMEKQFEWLNSIRDELYRTFRLRWKLISIYQLSDQLNFEDAILRTLFNGKICFY